MDHEYESTIDLGDGFGHVGANAVRDSLEAAVLGCAEPGEEIFVALDSPSSLRLVLRTDRELGDAEAALLREAVEDILRDAGEDGETLAMGELVRKDAAPAPR